MWSIIIASDLHFNNDSKRNFKKDDIERILTVKDKYNIKLVISAGDLTDNGTDGSMVLFKKTQDQLTPLKNEWVKPLENNNIQVFLTLGNHDCQKYLYNKPIAKYIRNKYDASYSYYNKYRSGYYVREFNDIIFLSCGIYPKRINWIKNQLEKYQNKQIIIFYHYNTIEDETGSDWWKQSEKEDFYNIIKNYKNIIAIINGHIHQTYDKEWRGFKMLNGGGQRLLLMTMENNKLINIKKLPLDIEKL